MGEYQKNCLKKTIFVVLAIISLSIHAVGAYGFDASWYKKTEVSVEEDRLWLFRESPPVHYGQRLFLKNPSILRTGLSGIPTSPQSPHMLAAALMHQEFPTYHTA
jgi:hypothetical protein